MVHSLEKTTLASQQLFPLHSLSLGGLPGTARHHPGLFTSCVPYPGVDTAKPFLQRKQCLKYFTKITLTIKAQFLFRYQRLQLLNIRFSEHRMH